MKCLISFFLVLFQVGSFGQDIQSTESNRLIHLYFDQGEHHFENQDFIKAIPIFLKIDSISKNDGIKNALTITAMLRRAEISKLSFTYETTNMAHSLLNEALNVAKEIDDEESEHLAYIQLADINQMIREFDDAKKYIDLALPYFTKKDDVKRVSRLMLLKTAYYLGVDSLDSSEQTHLEIIKYLETKENTYEKAKAFYYYGNFLRGKRNDYGKAIVHLEKAKELLQFAKKDSIELYQRTLRDLGYCYRQSGNYKEASSYYETAYDLKIDLLEKFNRSTSKTLEAKYQTEKKEQEIALLSAEKKIIAQLNKSQRNILIGGIGLSSLTGLFLFVLFRNRTKTNTKLRELDALKSNFFANISHEFRTPLTLISSPIQETLEEPDLTPEKRSHFEMASRNTERLLSLVDQLLDLSRIDSGNRALYLEKGRAARLISAWIDSFSYLAKQKSIALDVVIKDKEIEVWFDKDALEKIVVNLLGNAIKYTPTNGRITVNVFIKNKLLQLSVKNTGQGLTKDETKNIFNRFYQTNERNEGTGIGLSLVKELTTMHGGTIAVHSVKDNWTRFDVSICIDKTRFKNARFKEPSAIQQKPPSLIVQHAAIESGQLFENGMPILLIVEDNADVRILLSDTFKSDFQVITAKNGAEGIDLALRHIPDLIISDVMMPVKDGVELTKTLKRDERSSHIPIVLLTAKSGDENELKGLDVGADDYIIKPFNKKLLLSKVNGLIALRKKLQLRYSQEIILRPKDIAISSVDERFLEKVQGVLDEKLVESGFNSEVFSKAVHMSRMQLHRKLTALTGLTTSEFVRSQRLKLATHLLKQSQINISEVGYAVGFKDHAYFTKCFRETYNCTPTEFAKKG